MIPLGSDSRLQNMNFMNPDCQGMFFFWFKKLQFMKTHKVIQTIRQLKKKKKKSNEIPGNRKCHWVSRMEGPVSREFPLVHNQCGLEDVRQAAERGAPRLRQGPMTCCHSIPVLPSECLWRLSSNTCSFTWLLSIYLPDYRLCEGRVFWHCVFTICHSAWHIIGAQQISIK